MTSQKRPAILLLGLQTLPDACKPKLQLTLQT